MGLGVGHAITGGSQATQFLLGQTQYQQMRHCIRNGNGNCNWQR